MTQSVEMTLLCSCPYASSWPSSSLGPCRCPCPPQCSWSSTFLWPCSWPRGATIPPARQLQNWPGSRYHTSTLFSESLECTLLKTGLICWIYKTFKHSYATPTGLRSKKKSLTVYSVWLWCFFLLKEMTNQICLLLQYKLGSPLSLQEAKQELFKLLTQWYHKDADE